MRTAACTARADRCRRPEVRGTRSRRRAEPAAAWTATVPARRSRIGCSARKKHHRHGLRGGPAEGLVGVALAGRAVADAGQHDLIGAISLDAHAVADGVQQLGGEHDRVDLELVFVRVPAAVANAAEHVQELAHRHLSGDRRGVFAVGREDHVTVAYGPDRASLRAFLAEAGDPHAELPLALQCGRFLVEPAAQHHVAVERPRQRRVGGEQMSGCPGEGAVWRDHRRRLGGVAEVDPRVQLVDRVRGGGGNVKRTGHGCSSRGGGGCRLPGWDCGPTACGPGMRVSPFGLCRSSYGRR